LELVNLILEYLEQRWGRLPGFLVLSDSSNRVGAEGPPRIGGFAPDVYAADVPITTMVIGEAKTSEDLTRAHSREQLCAYLEHLRFQLKGILIVAVPCFFAASARIVVETARRSQGVRPEEVEVVILELFES
jgi:hypothetical protein